MQTLTLPLSAILVEDRLRAVDMTRAGELAISFREAGQITPIEVGPEDASGKHRLIAGAHRVAAAQLAGMAAIQAVVFEGSADAGRLREIDENLYRRELSPLDQAAFLAERRAIYERIFGEVKAGRRNRGKLPQLSFFDDVTDKFGLGRDTVKRALRRRAMIGGAAWALIAGTKLAEKGAVLDGVARLKPDQQIAVIQALLDKRASTIAGALALLGHAPVVDEDLRQKQALLSAWAKAGAKARGELLAFLATTQTKAMQAALRRQASSDDSRDGGAA